MPKEKSLKEDKQKQESWRIYIQTYKLQNIDKIDTYYAYMACRKAILDTLEQIEDCKFSELGNLIESLKEKYKTNV